MLPFLPNILLFIVRDLVVRQQKRQKMFSLKKDIKTLGFITKEYPDGKPTAIAPSRVPVLP